jgi:formyltetrahydrofolate deformylase
MRENPALHANRGRLLISCPDCSGIVASVSQFLFERGANIVQSDQYTTDPTGGLFSMRIEFDLLGLLKRGPSIERDFAPLADRFAMTWRLEYAARRKRLAVFVSREEHCLLELFWRWQSGDLAADFAMVVSNHPDLGPLVASWGIPFHHVPIDAVSKADAEARQFGLLDGEADVIVLARYMQILSSDFISRWPNRIINIHHSFLPAFAGSNPYQQAYQRGVKLIGATAHYVTENLDAGPIIEQDIQRVDHRHTVAELRRRGRYIERTVLSRAVGWHVEDRILVHDNRTVVFD